MAEWYSMSEKVRGIPVTRYIASWYRSGGTNYRSELADWLRTLVVDGEPLTNEEVDLIADCATIGKLELELSAKKWLKNKR